MARTLLLSLVPAALFAGTVDCSTFDVPKPTGVRLVNQVPEAIPEPTAKAVLGYSNLVERQSYNPALCGYIDGNLGKDLYNTHMTDYFTLTDT
jgi:hypothetical protein